MEAVLTYLGNSPLLAIFLSLAIGYCIGRIKIGSFSIGATVGTLIVAFTLSRLTPFDIPAILKTLFSILFCFTLGYEAGPAFFKSLKSQGIKFVLHAVFFCLFSFLTMYVLGITGIPDRDGVIGAAAAPAPHPSMPLSMPPTAPFLHPLLPPPTPFPTFCSP